MPDDILNLERVVPISVPGRPVDLHYPVLKPSDLEAQLLSRGYEVKLGEPLKGGVVSQVFEAKNANGDPVVVKYTCDLRSDDPTENYLSHSSHFVDQKILSLLHDAQIRVPTMLATFDEYPVTVMNDLRVDGFHLIHDDLLRGVLPDAQVAYAIGRDLAHIIEVLSTATPFRTMFSPYEIILDRGMELKELYPWQHYFFDLQKTFVSEQGRQLIPVDTHPKNIFTDGARAAWIDFGFSTWGDPDFVLPNCMAHFAVYSAAGYLEPSTTAHFLETMIDGYLSSGPGINEAVASRYFAMEVLHRSAGKRILGIDTIEQKTAIIKYGDKALHAGALDLALRALASTRAHA